MKKGFIIGAIIAIALAIIGLIVAIILITGALVFVKDDNSTKNTTITIKFDTAGGNDLKSIKVRKDEATNLPTPVRDGYKFDGWYYDETLIDEDYTFKKDITLTAKWVLTTNTPKTYTISFNSNGGSKVKNVIIKCDDTVKLPSNPTKAGYTFVSWADKHGKVILDGALLTCDDITLYANWEKNEETTKSTKTETTVNETYYKKEETKEGIGECPGGLVVTRNNEYLCKYTKDATSEEITAGKCNDSEYTLTDNICIKYTKPLETTE